MEKDKSNIYKIFGENIKRFREERNMTLDELSELTSIRVPYLKKIEFGTAKRLNAGHIFIFAIAFNIKPHEVLKGL